jgi:aryl-alcohol dehydrogenase-like predicted oxidoreductase
MTKAEQARVLAWRLKILRWAADEPRQVARTCRHFGISRTAFYRWKRRFEVHGNTRFADGDIRKVESRFSPENLPHNLTLVDLVKRWGERKRATPAQIALAWLLAQKPWIVPIPGTTQMAHMVENVGAAAIRFTPAELAEFNAAASAIGIRGARLPDSVLVFSDVEAPPK